MHFQKSYIYLLLFVTFSVFSQTTTLRHKVEKGESVYSIAKKYHVSMEDILEINPKAKNTLSLNMVLKIPTKETKETKETKAIKETKGTIVKLEAFSHEVVAKETLYGIAKKYKISIEQLKKDNPFIESEGLKIGAKLVIHTSEKVFKEANLSTSELPQKEEKVVVEKHQDSEEIIHVVQAKETKYGISKKYGISINQLEASNPEIVKELPIGFALHIKGAKNAISEAVVQTQEVKATPKALETPVVVKPTLEESDEAEEVTDEDKERSTSQIQVVETKPSEITTIPVPPLSADSVTKAEFLIAKASENIGTRYRGGGTTKDGFDCSGLVFSTFKNIEMTLPRSSREMAGYGNAIDRAQAQKGDLIFFTTNGRGTINHVGLITEVLEDEIKFIHSSVRAGVIISSTKEPYYTKRFVQVNRVLP